MLEGSRLGGRGVQRGEEFCKGCTGICRAVPFGASPTNVGGREHFLL